MRKPYGTRIHARRPSDDGRLRFRIVLGKLRAIICLHKKLGGTAFATPPYKTRGFFIWIHYALPEPAVNQLRQKSHGRLDGVIGGREIAHFEQLLLEAR